MTECRAIVLNCSRRGISDHHQKQLGQLFYSGQTKMDKAAEAYLVHTGGDWAIALWLDVRGPHQLVQENRPPLLEFISVPHEQRVRLACS